MSIKAIQWAFELELDDPTGKLVLLALADHYNDQSECCWPSMARLEHYTGADERTIQRAIARLQEGGYVEREERAGHSSLFYLPLMPTPVRLTPRQNDAPPPSTRRGTPVKLTPHPRQSDAHNLQGTVIEPSENAATGSLAPDGARPTPTSREEWQRRLDGYDPQRIRETWALFWGPRPDAVGEGHFLPRDLLAAWRTHAAPKIARQG